MAQKRKKNDSLLIIFYRNPELGKVKTRLAATMGDAKAYSIYLLLSEHTRTITERLPFTKALYYSDFVDQHDSWPEHLYHKFVQNGEDLGERMLNAFKAGFDQGYKSICIIGTDCLELNSNLITEAFRKLNTYDISIGPANDGGYYLLGMNYLHPLLFTNKSWSTPSVFKETERDIKLLGLTYWQLQMLNDVDEENDLPAHFKSTDADLWRSLPF
jgi:hypothetical protein